MPNSKLADANPAILGIDPPVTLAQANEIAAMADAITDVESPWAVAISQWKKGHIPNEAETGWVKKAVEEADISIDEEPSPEKERTVGDMTVAELAQFLREVTATSSLNDRERAVRNAFDAQHGRSMTMPEPAREYWVKDVLESDPELGDAVVFDDEANGKLMAAPYSKDTNGNITFGPAAEWREVKLQYVLIKVSELAESAKEPEIQEKGEPEPVILKEQGDPMQAQMMEHVRVIEAKAFHSDDPQGPVSVTFEPIQPGWGNPKDNNYYPAPMLAAHPEVFVGAKMFLSEHESGSHNERNHVSMVKSHIGFSTARAPQYDMVVYDPYTAQKVRNMKAAGALGALEFSIFANGQRRSATIDGKKGYVVESIDSDPKPIIDWVSRAGAGGRAVSVQEKDTEVKMLEKEQVRAFLSEHANLPQVSVDRLLVESYETEDSLKERLDAEVEYVKAVTGSGKPFGMAGQPPKVGMTVQEAEEQKCGIEERFGLVPARTIRD